MDIGMMLEGLDAVLDLVSSIAEYKSLSEQCKDSDEVKSENFTNTKMSRKQQREMYEETKRLVDPAHYGPPRHAKSDFNTFEDDLGGKTASGFRDPFEESDAVEVNLGKAESDFKDPFEESDDTVEVKSQKQKTTDPASLKRELEVAETYKGIVDKVIKVLEFETNEMGEVNTSMTYIASELSNSETDKDLADKHMEICKKHSEIMGKLTELCNGLKIIENALSKYEKYGEESE